MMDNKIILKNKEADCETSVLGISGENEQQRLIFSFEDGFVDGSCFLELELPDGHKGSTKLDKEDETYFVIVKNSLLTQIGEVKMQLKIIQKTAVWKSTIFEMTVIEAIKASETIEEDYPNWVEDMTIRMGELEEGVSQIAKDVAGLENYDDTEVRNEIEQVKKDVELIEVSEISDFEVDKMFQPRTFCHVDLENASVVSSTNEADGDYFTRGTEITVKANEAPEGYVVDYLEVVDKHNHIKYSEAQYKFSVEEDTMIKAVYAKEGEAGEPLISVTLQQSAEIYGSHGDTIFLLARRNTFKPYVVNEWGILRTFGDEELTLENANANENITKRAAKVSDIWSRNILPTSMSLADYIGKNAIMRAVAYANLTRDGVTETIYSNEISVDIDGEIAILNELR